MGEGLKYFSHKLRRTHISEDSGGASAAARAAIPVRPGVTRDTAQDDHVNKRTGAADHLIHDPPSVPLSYSYKGKAADEAEQDGEDCPAYCHAMHARETAPTLVLVAAARSRAEAGVAGRVVDGHGRGDETDDDVDRGNDESWCDERDERDKHGERGHQVHAAPPHDRIHGPNTQHHAGR